MARTGPSPVFKSRLQRCRRAMAAKKISAYLITNRHDHYYLIGFSGEDSAVLITAKEVHIISDGRFDTSLKQEAPWAKVALRKGLLADEIVAVVRGYRLKQLAVQADVMPVAQREELAGKLKGVKIVSAPSIVSDLRLLKAEDELQVIDKAIRVAEQAYQAMLKTIRVGQTELELAARAGIRDETARFEHAAFDSIVAVDANAALPHAFPGTRKVRKGCLILFDWGATTRLLPQ